MPETVRSKCPERDRLWSLYESALRTYVVALGEYTKRTVADQIHSSSESDPAHARIAVHLTYMYVWECRTQITKHCESHRCDPLAGEVLKARALHRELMPQGIHTAEPW